MYTFAFSEKVTRVSKKVTKSYDGLTKSYDGLTKWWNFNFFFSFHIEKSLPRWPKTLPTLCLISDPRASISHHKRLYSTALGRHFHVSDRSALWRFRGFEPSLT